MALGTKRRAKIELEGNTKHLERSLDNARKRLRAFGTESEKSMAMGTIGLGLPGGTKKAMRDKAGNTRGAALAGGIAGGLTGMLTGAALGTIAGAGDEVLAFEKGLTRFEIATGKSRLEMDQMRKSIVDVSRATGIARAEVLAGAHAYVGFTGDAAGAVDAARMFADVSTATGAKVTDVAQAFAALRTSMNITAKEGEAAFSALIVQGDLGAVELADMAASLSSIAPQFAQFKGGKGLGGLRELGAGFQVIMKNAKNAPDAEVKYRALMSSLSDPRTVKGLKKIGVSVFGADKKMRSFSNIARELARNQKLLDPMMMSKVFGREEARMAVLALQEHIGLYDQLRTAAEDTGAVQQRKAKMLASAGGRIEAAFNAAKLAIAESLTPERIELFARALQKVVELLAKAVGFVENLFDTTGLTELWEQGPAAAHRALALRGTANMSPEEKFGRSEALMRDAAVTLSRDHSDEDKLIADIKHQAASTLRHEAAAQVTIGDLRKLAEQIASAIQRTPPNVNIDGNRGVNAFDNASAHRRPGR